MHMGTIMTQQDMWSLGVTLYAMLCRGYPYRRRDDNPATNQYMFVRTMLEVRPSGVHAWRSQHH